MPMRAATLPRHTNLAPQGLRIAAAIVDFAIWLGLALLLYFFAFSYAVSGKVNESVENTNRYLIESHLCIKDESGNVKYIVSDKTEDYQNAVEGYYLRYLANNPLDGEAVSPDSIYPINIDGKEVMPKDLFNVAYYNKNVLKITQDNPDSAKSESLFTFQKDSEGNYLKNEPAIRRTKHYNSDIGIEEELTEEDFLHFYKSDAYPNAYRDLVRRDFYKSTADVGYFYTTLAIVSASVVSAIVFYVVLPWILKNGQTIGKKIFKLGLATYDGYLFKNSQLLLRIVPFLLALLAQLIPVIFSQILYLVIFYVALVLVSFALMMASPKKAALHDFAARTIVVELSSSILFENELMEEQYIAREDNLPIENESSGEEPELKYER